MSVSGHPRKDLRIRHPESRLKPLRAGRDGEEEQLNAPYLPRLRPLIH
jgi:hypothetical protein